MVDRSIDTDVDEAPGFRVWRGEPYASMPFHWHDQVEINYAVGGSITYQLAGSVVRVPPGRLSLFWAGIPHSVPSRTDMECFYWIYVPLVWMLRLGLPRAFMRSVMGGEMVVDADPLAADREMLERWADELVGADEPFRRLIVQEIEARILRFALSQPDEAEGGLPAPRDHPAQKVSEMARFIAHNYAESLRLRDVAQHVGLHPNYALTLFSRSYGMTVNAYLTRLRVCQAQGLLISTDWDTPRIAREVGFGSPSRFYEAFKAVSGKTPRQYRLLPGMR